jgi:hypothetical protein
MIVTSASCREPMLVVRAVSVIRNRVHRRQIRRIQIGPSVDVFRLDWDDAPVMSGGGYLCGDSSVTAAKDRRPGSPGADQHDHKQATSMS